MLPLWLTQIMMIVIYIYIYICLHICICICICACVYIYIYIYREREREIDYEYTHKLSSSETSPSRSASVSPFRVGEEPPSTSPPTRHGAYHMCECVLMYVCMYVCIYIYIYTYIYIYVYIEREGPRLRVTTVQFGAPRPQAAGCLVRLQLPPSPSTRAREANGPPLLGKGTKNPG